MVERADGARTITMVAAVVAVAVEFFPELSWLPLQIIQLWLVLVVQSLVRQVEVAETVRYLD